MIVYAYDGQLYPAAAVDVDAQGNAGSEYTRYEIPDIITLRAEDCMRGYGNILEILLQAGQAKGK